MSVLFTRAVVVPAGMVLFALIALLAPPFGATTRIPQLLGLALVESALFALMVSTILALVARTRTPHGAVVDNVDNGSLLTGWCGNPSMRLLLSLVDPADLPPAISPIHG